jgi:hypothetical protein
MKIRFWIVPLLPSGSHQTLHILYNKRFRHFLVGPDLGEEFEVRLEKGKTLQVKLLTPGLSVSAAICRLCLTNKFHYRNCFVFSYQ